MIRRVSLMMYVVAMLAIPVPASAGDDIPTTVHRVAVGLPWVRTPLMRYMTVSPVLPQTWIIPSRMRSWFYHFQQSTRTQIPLT